jgi:hypothetical protein
LKEDDREIDPYGWFLCTEQAGHNPVKLMPTQIIPGNALECLGHLVHSFRKQWNIEQFCDCPEAAEGNAAIEAAKGSNGNAISNGMCKVICNLSLYSVDHLVTEFLGCRHQTGIRQD